MVHIIRPEIVNESVMSRSPVSARFPCSGAIESANAAGEQQHRICSGRVVRRNDRLAERNEAVRAGVAEQCRDRRGITVEHIVSGGDGNDAQQIAPILLH